MKRLLTIIFYIIMFGIMTVYAQNKTLYDFQTLTIDGKPFDLSSLRGKKVLVVNTASKCGFTPQYEGLQKLYEKYGGKNFVIIAFPANNFLGQEPGTNQEIKTFCETNYGITFPIMSKISVKGKDIDPIYKWLTTKELNGVMDAQVKWNFQKFMIDENGKIVDVAWPKEEPDCEKIINWLNKK